MVWNHSSSAIHEDVLVGNCVEKHDTNINGGQTYASVHLKASSNTNPSKEVSTPVCSGQPSYSSSKELVQSKVLETEDQLKLSSKATENGQCLRSQCIGENVQSAKLEAHSNGINPAGPEYPPNASQAGKQRCAGNDTVTSNHAHPEQSTDSTLLSEQRGLPLCKTESCSPGDTACKTGMLNVCVHDNTLDHDLSLGPKTDALQEAKHTSYELEEDPEIAEALAALDAATAGEEFEEETFELEH